MKNKGLTLVEMLAVIIVLSFVAVIVTPNIYNEIKQSKEDLYLEQLDNIKEAAVNWVGDHIDMVPTIENSGLYISIQDLQEDGYIDDNMKNIKNSSILDESDIFVLARSELIEDDSSIEPNYKYTYGVYETLDDYQIKMAEKYAKDINLSTSTTVTTQSLTEGKYIASTIVDVNNSNVALTPHNMTVVKDKNKYKVTIN